jgi:hypothetical protein
MTSADHDVTGSFGGTTIDETAEALHLSPATLKHEWAMACVCLY